MTGTKSTEVETNFFRLCMASPKGSYEKNEQTLAAFRDSELIEQGSKLHRTFLNLKEEVIGNTTTMLSQTGAKERLTYLESLLRRTESCIKEMGRPNAAFALIADKSGFEQSKKFQSNSKVYLEEFAEFLKAEMNEKPKLKSDPLSLKDKKNYSLRQVCIAVKYYALYHWVLIDMKVKEKPLKNDSDKWVKREIENIAKSEYSLSNTQGFYRAFIEIDINKLANIRQNFGEGYKEKLLSISHNDSKVALHLRKYPD